jgi:hypothetical protein
VDVPVNHSGSDRARTGNDCVAVVIRGTGAESSEQVRFDHAAPVEAEMCQARVQQCEKWRRRSASQGNDDERICRTSRGCATQSPLDREPEGIDGGGDSDSRRVSSPGAPESPAFSVDVKQHRP